MVLRTEAKVQYSMRSAVSITLQLQPALPTLAKLAPLPPL